jgi:hypothetical protein
MRIGPGTGLDVLSPPSNSLLELDDYALSPRRFRVLSLRSDSDVLRDADRGICRDRTRPRSNLRRT